MAAFHVDAPAETSSPVSTEGACGPLSSTRPFLYAVKHDHQHGHTMQEITDINLATFIKVVKGIPLAGHRFNGHQLCLQFEIDAENLKLYEREYMNSTYADYDATKRNLVRLLKRGK